jgi:hypothetical protein
MQAMQTPGQCAALVDHEICPLVALPYTAFWYTKCRMHLQQECGHQIAALC